MRWSLGTRLLAVAGVVMLLLLPVAGWVIGQAFERSALAGLEARVEAYASTLAGLLEFSPQGRIGLSRPPQELRFEQVYSGWYWQVVHQGKVQLTSRSLWDASLAIPDPAAPRGSSILDGPRGESLVAVSLRLNLAGTATPVVLTVTAPADEIAPEIVLFRRTLTLALGSLGGMLLVIFALQVRWGLAPMRRMERELQDVRRGARDRIDPGLPRDLRAVAEVMNEVLAHQEALIQRARLTAGNLAHALKTPLSTLRLRLHSNPQDVDGLRDDLRRVREIVDHHLMRAAAAGRAVVRQRHTDLRGAIQPLVDAVRGMMRERPVQLVLDFEGDAEVSIEPQDLQELVGNLLDNAMKWAGHRVELRIDPRPGHVVIEVHDDGPGIPDAARQRAVDRGVRLDEQHAGSGLGLAIVRDLAALYEIGFGLDHSPLGGLVARVELPRSPAGR